MVEADVVACSDMFMWRYSHQLCLLLSLIMKKCEHVLDVYFNQIWTWGILRPGGHFEGPILHITELFMCLFNTYVIVFDRPSVS